MIKPFTHFIQFWGSVSASIFVTLSFFSTPLQAQTPSDSWMMKKKEICIALTYDRGHFDEYWEGSLLRTNETIATVSRKTIMPMVAIGIFNDLNFYVAVPYVKTESSNPNGGLFQGAKGFQDLSLAVKYRAINKTMGNGKLEIFAAGGFSTPISNYLSDYRPYSIGNGTDEWSLRAIAQYRLSNGLYLRTMAGHFFRGQTKAERDFYYNNGSYYSAWMDVPNAWEYNVAAGIWLFDSSLKLEATYYAQQSTSGDDIRRYNAPQPTNKVEFNQIGFSAQYYFKSLKGLGLLAYSSQVLSGRNTGKATLFGAGATYQFQL